MCGPSSLYSSNVIDRNEEVNIRVTLNVFFFVFHLKVHSGVFLSMFSINSDEINHETNASICANNTQFC